MNTRWAIWIGATFAAVALILALLYLQAVRWLDTPLAVTTSRTYEISTGSTLTRIANDLAELGLMDQPGYFIAWGRWLSVSERLQAGEYALEPGVTPRRLLQQFAAGKVVQHEFRVREGDTVAGLLARLQADQRLQHQLTGVTETELIEVLGLDVPFAEGYFFPDTYLFQRDETDRSLLLRAHAQLREKLQVIWTGRDGAVALDGPHELLILASIIEKETGVEEDRLLISQVFHNRLRLRMRLQSDPTVIYGLGAAFDGNLRRADLRADTPYNTYTRRGLPPTPIALVSEASLRAAAHPVPGPYLYFVSRGDGTSQFSTTLAEHNAAVRKYQLNRNQGR